MAFIIMNPSYNKILKWLLNEKWPNHVHYDFIILVMDTFYFIGCTPNKLLKIKVLSLFSSWHIKKINQVAEDETVGHSNHNFPRRCTQGPPTRSHFLLGTHLPPMTSRRAPSPCKSRFSAPFPRGWLQRAVLALRVSSPFSPIPQEWEVALEKVTPFRVNV